MAAAGETHPLIKVRYRPIEAAIRWSGLAEHEEEILRALKRRVRLGPRDFPQWPLLRLNTERIYDAMRNDELPYGVDGTTTQRKGFVDHPRVTVRHTDLKVWMTRFYPDQRPAFLYSEIEQELVTPLVTIDTVRFLLAERDILRSQLGQLREHASQRRGPGRTDERLSASAHLATSDQQLGERADTTYLHIIGGLVGLLLGHTPSGQPYSSFKTQEAIISALIAHHRGRLGMSERTLRAKFAEARRRLPLD